MSKETETQTQRLFVAKDMTCTLTFSGPREFDSQDLQNLIAQLDMQRAMMDGEQLQVRASITSGAPAERRHLREKDKVKPKVDNLSIPGPTPPTIAPQVERLARPKATIGAFVSRAINGMPASPPVPVKTPEELAAEVAIMEAQRAG